MSNVFQSIIELIIRFVWPILLLVIILTCLNIIIDYKKYGKKIFDSFKKVDNEGKMKDLLVQMFKGEMHDKVLVLERDSDYFIIITKYDIFVIQLINVGASIVGSTTDRYLKIEKGSINEFENPLSLFLEESRILLENKIDIKCLIVMTNKSCNLNLSDFDKKNIYNLKDFSYMLYRLQHSHIKYSKEDMDNNYNKIKEILDGNN